MKITIKKSGKCGFEVYESYVNGINSGYTFWSIAGARNWANNFIAKRKGV